jgi:hypothetical protein
MIVTRLIGGLGNQLFQYSAGRRLAYARGAVLKLDVSGFEDYALRRYALGTFNIEENFATPEEVARLTSTPRGLCGRIVRRLLRRPAPPPATCVREAALFRFDPRVLDLPDGADHVEHPGGQRGILVRGINVVNLHQGDGIEVGLDVCRAAVPGCRPLFLLDGDHSYASVRRELDGIASSWPLAWILMHDTFFQSPESGYNIVPHRAVEDALASWQPRPRRFATGTGLPGMTLLYHTQTARTGGERE